MVNEVFRCVTPDGDYFGQFASYEEAQANAEIANKECKYGKDTWMSSGDDCYVRESDDNV